MYKSHGKEYLENNFSSEELESLMRPPPGSNTSKPTPSPRKIKDDEILIAGSPTGVLPISPPLTPKLSPKQAITPRSQAPSDDSDTSTISLVMPPALRLIPSQATVSSPQTTTPKRCRPGPASLTKPKHYFDTEAELSLLLCQLCDDKFLRRSDLHHHLGRDHGGVPLLACPACQDRFLEPGDLARHMTLVHGHKGGEGAAAPAHHQLKDAAADLPLITKRRPGPASRTNAPQENRTASAAAPLTSSAPVSSSNLPSHLAAQYGDSPGYPCSQCGKVLMHKQSYVSHMRVIHGDYYGGNRWRGSSVVEMVLGGEDNSLEGREELTDVCKEEEQQQQQLKAQLTAALKRIAQSSGLSPNYADYPKLGLLACEFCHKAYSDRTTLDDHVREQHPYLTQRIQAFKEALGLKDSADEPDKKRIKLDYKGIIMNDDIDLLPSQSVPFLSAAHHAQHISANGYDEPLDLACRPVSVSIDDKADRADDQFAHHDSNNNNNFRRHCNGNNLLQVVVNRPCPSPPCSPLNLHISRPASPSLPPPPPPPHVADEPPPEEPFPTPQGTPDVASAQAVGSTPRVQEYLVKQNHATADEHGRKKFLCPVCKCQLSWKTNLSVHLRTHSGERPFQCVLCLNRFRQKAHLYKHFRCSHGHKVAPFKCLFCIETFSRSPNDLYNHITEVHKKETDEMQSNNSNNNNNNNTILSYSEDSKEEEEDRPQSVPLALVTAPTPPSDTPPQKSPQSTARMMINDEEEEEDVEDEETEEDDDDDDAVLPPEVRDRDDDVRYEPVTEEFLFEGDMIKPCYCVLPFVTDEEVEAVTRRSISVIF